MVEVHGNWSSNVGTKTGVNGPRLTRSSNISTLWQEFRRLFPLDPRYRAVSGASRLPPNPMVSLEVLVSALTSCVQYQTSPRTIPPARLSASPQVSTSITKQVGFAGLITGNASLRLLFRSFVQNHRCSTAWAPVSRARGQDFVLTYLHPGPHQQNGNCRKCNSGESREVAHQMSTSKTSTVEKVSTDDQYKRFSSTDRRFFLDCENSGAKICQYKPLQVMEGGKQWNLGMTIAVEPGPPDPLRRRLWVGGLGDHLSIGISQITQPTWFQW